MYGILEGHWKQSYGGSIQTRSWKRLILITMAKSYCASALLDDQFIVPEKQGNACLGKGLAGARWAGRDTPPIPRDGLAKHFDQTFLKFDLSTKLWFITQRAREDPSCNFTSLAHLLTADFLKECFRELKKDKENSGSYL